MRIFKERGRTVKIEENPKEEEPDMLFLEINEYDARTNRWKVIGSAFCRNSGTEAKTTVYARGRLDDRILFGHIVDTGREYVTLAMKTRHSLEVMAQNFMVEILATEPTGIITRDQLIQRLCKERRGFNYIDLGAIIDQSRDKEQILAGNIPADNPVLMLGPRGRWFFNNFAREAIVREYFYLIEKELSAVGIKPMDVNIVIKEVDEPTSRSSFNTITRTLTVYINPGPRGTMTLREQIPFALYHCIIATPARVKAAERQQIAWQELKDGKRQMPDFYGVTIKESALIDLISCVGWEIGMDQIPKDENGMFGGVAGGLPFRTVVPSGQLTVLVPNVVASVEKDSTLMGDGSGVVNSQKLIEAAIREIVSARRPGLSDEDGEKLANHASLKLNTFNIWAAGAWSEEAELSHGLKGNRATITLPTGFSFIPALIQESAMLTNFRAERIIDFIDAWQPGRELTGFETGISVWSACDRVSLVTNPDFFTNLRDSCGTYGLTMAGNIVDLDNLPDDDIISAFGWLIINKEGKVVDIVRYPETKEILKNRKDKAPDGCQVAISWHLVGFSQKIIHEMAKEDNFGKLYEKHIGLTRDIVDAVLTISDDGKGRDLSENEWVNKRESNDLLSLQYTQEEWIQIFHIARSLFDKGIGFTNAGDDAIFFDIGSTPTAFSVMRAFGEDSDLGELLRTKFGLEEYYVDCVGGKALVVNSDLGSDVKLEPGAVVVNTSVKNGHIAGVVIDVASTAVEVPHTSMLYDIYRSAQEVKLGVYELGVDWYLQGQEDPVLAVTDVRRNMWRERMQEGKLSCGHSLVELVREFDVDKTQRVRDNRADHLRATLTAAAATGRTKAATKTVLVLAETQDELGRELSKIIATGYKFNKVIDKVVTSQEEFEAIVYEVKEQIANLADFLIINKTTFTPAVELLNDIEYISDDLDNQQLQHRIDEWL